MKNFKSFALTLIILAAFLLVSLMWGNLIGNAYENETLGIVTVTVLCIFSMLGAMKVYDLLTE